MKDYHKGLEMTLTRGNIIEDEEATISRFINGLNPKIANKVEMVPYVNMEDLLHQATKAERIIKRSKASTMSQCGSSTWRGAWSKEA